MLKKEQAIELLDELMELIKQHDTAEDDFSRAVGGVIDSPFFQTSDAITRFATEMLERMILPDGETNWIYWYIWENDMGKNCYTAGYDGVMKPIITTTDLYELMVEK